MMIDDDGPRYHSVLAPLTEVYSTIYSAEEIARRKIP
jgi:hypothetical protein